MLYDTLARAHREISEHLQDHPEQYRRHADHLHALQAAIADTLDALARPAEAALTSATARRPALARRETGRLRFSPAM